MAQDFLFGCGDYTGDGVCLTPGRRPDCLEMVLVLRGKVSVKTAMYTYGATAGDVLFFSPDMVRTIKARDEQATIRYIYFSLSLFEGLTESIDRDLYYMFMAQLRTRENRVKETFSVYKTVRRAMETCYEEYLSKELCYTLRIRGYLSMMMAELLSSYSTRRENDRMVYQNVLRLRPTLRYISKHFDRHISVPELAEQLPVTPDYYTKLFRDSIGKTTVDYINCERINRSMILLLETDTSVADIAVQVGLGSGNYFSKLFKSIIGTTPLAFRKSAR